MKATAKHLIGRRIIAVDWHAFYDKGRGCMIHRPEITLDSGRRLWFVTEESEGDYGTLICISAATKGAAT
ncbi:MAG: hypothetical protein V4502_06120 [Pseudomonadota bacterium]